VVKGEVCKTSMQRFESARRLQTTLDIVQDFESTTHDELSESSYYSGSGFLRIFAIVGISRRNGR
jgi:hypothetical protein